MNGDEYLERVRELIPAFRERATLTERTRRELHPAAFYRAVMEVGAACPSTAWVLGVCSRC